MTGLLRPTPRIFDGLYYAAYLLVIPGFYIYQNAVASGTAPFLGGYLVFSCIVSLGLLLPGYLTHITRGGVPLRIDAIFFVGLLYYIAWGAYQGQFDHRNIAIGNYQSATFAWVTFFFLGRLIPAYRTGLRRVALISHLVMLAIIFTNIEDGVFALGLGQDVVGQETASYQAFSLIFTINLVFLLYTDRSTVASLINLLVGAVVIVLVGSRSEAMFVIAFGGFLVLRTQYKIMAIAAMSLVAVLAAASSGLASLFPRNRFSDLLETGGASTRAARDYANKRGWETILDNPITGSFANYDVGLYPHNILSIWVDFGVLGFILYVAALAFAIYVIARDHLEGLGDKNNLLAMAFASSCAVLLLTTKAGDYYAVAFAIGLCAHRHTRAMRFAILRPTIRYPRAQLVMQAGSRSH